MPRGDGTGPLGNGPKTGRGLGRCSSTINTNIPINNLMFNPQRTQDSGIIRGGRGIYCNMLGLQNRNRRGQ